MTKRIEIATINSDDFKLHDSDFEFGYQDRLTRKLEKEKGDFNQFTINEIVLWKVNRYAELSKETLDLLNCISNTSNIIDVELTKRILRLLISTPGIKLPMASTILRFKNSEIYQIIDQRVYRLLYGKELRISSYISANGIEEQICLYLKYLSDLKIKSQNFKIPFNIADRVLYKVDKRINKEISLENY